MKHLTLRLVTLSLLAAALVGLTGCAEVEALRQRSATQEARIAALQEENKEFRANYYQIKEMYDTEVAGRQKETDRLERELNEARNLKSQREKELEDQIQSLQLEFEAHRREANDLKTFADTQISNLSRDVKTLTTERDAALQKVTQLTNELMTEQGVNQKLTEEVAALKVEAQSLGQKVSTLEQDLTVRGEELEAAKQAQQAAEASLQERTSERDALQQKLTEVEQALATAIAERDEARASLEQATQERDTARQELESERQAAAAAGTEQADLRSQLEAARARIAELEAGGPGENTEQLNAEHEKEVADLREQLAEARQARADLAEDPELKALSDRLSEALSSVEQVEIRHDAKGVRIILPGSALFAPDSVVLSETSDRLLAPVAEALSGMNGRRIRVEGHTDNTPVGENLPFADNWGLGFARADRVREYLARHGISAGLMRAISAAEYEPLASNDSDEGRSRNRRVEIVIAESI